MAEPEKCSASSKDCIHYRRCFMSGEYCSRQANIQKERERLHAEGKINAFVIMDFSNMSTVVYNWRIKPFIESLKNYLQLEGDKIICYPERIQQTEKGERNSTSVKQINVIRADTDNASNYVVCNRICQQMQMADLIIVDVSFENANVFYEFGLAVALGKLILPICYSESFYDVRFPEQLAALLETEGADDEIKRHIDCYPWRRTLFEHFGIRYRSKKDSEALDESLMISTETEGKEPKRITKYLGFKKATDKKYGFSDIQYRKFPYLDSIDDPQNGKSPDATIGKIIYTRLCNTYNNSRYEHNTLVVYTLEGFLNEYQAGQCIINFYNHITNQMKLEYCFCGDRVGTLIQTNTIPEKDKDAWSEKRLLYNVGEIIHLGINEATYAAERNTIKTKDVLKVPQEFWGRDNSKDVLKVTQEFRECNTSKEEPEWTGDIRIFTKGYLGNKSISVYPKTPVYVKRIINGLQSDVFKLADDSSLNYYFCLYHVMLRTLKYTNELVVDISKTPLESLFWLGAAHGSNINAITVRHEESESERMMLTGSAEKRERPIFDVAGLWSAILRSHDTEGFYHQLALAQRGIEQHSKLMLKDLPYYEDQLIEGLYRDLHDGRGETGAGNNTQEQISRTLKWKEEQDLESYYRDRFWKPMLSKEHLRIYLPQVDGTDEKDKEPKANAVRWDVDAIATLSHYLSIRTHIGEYSFRAIGKKEVEEAARSSNFITVGSDAKPLEGNDEINTSLAEYIQSKLSQENSGDDVLNLGDRKIHTFWKKSPPIGCAQKEASFRGFIWDKGPNPELLYTQLSQSHCYQCMNPESSQEAEDKIFSALDEIGQNECFLKGKGDIHTQLAQLVLWREVDRENKKVWLWTSITGVSGPSTLALSTILVNESQRAEKFGLERNDLTGQNEENENQNGVKSQAKADEDRVKSSELKKEDLEAMKNPLSELQAMAREKFVNAFIKTLNYQDDTYIDNQPKEACREFTTRIRYSAVLYLSSVLYRYFLPFLSLEDEKKLLHGMHFFLFSLLASETVSYPATCENQQMTRKTKENQIVQETVEALKTVLHKFQGVEALYRVKVQTEENSSCDSRKSRCIRPLEGDSVNCLFVD